MSDLTNEDINALTDRLEDVVAQHMELNDYEEFMPLLTRELYARYCKPELENKEFNYFYIYELPTQIMLPRKTKDDLKVYLNHNVAVRWKSFHYNNIKKAFKPIKDAKMPACEKIRISYMLHKKFNRRFDTMNVIAIVDKFFLDWLVKDGRLPDDDHENVSYGSIDAKGGTGENRVYATIEVIK